MQRHGDGSHVYSLPSSRLRLQRASSDNPLGSIHSVAQPQSLHHRDGQGSDPATTAARKPRYTPEYWHLLSLKRSLSGNRSEPSSPTSPNPPTLAQDASRRPTSHASRASSTLVATLLHVPTGVIYAWPIALSGASNGKCMVTQPHDTLPGAEAFDADRVMSESIKVLADVIKAWIKTSAMREALRRKESKREKGARKLGEDERDAIWLNESLGLAVVDEGTHTSALERSWKEEGELTSPPSQSPSQSPRISASHTRNQPSTSSSSHTGLSSRNAVVSGTSTPDSTTSKPATPRIEISAPDYFDGLSQALAPIDSATVARDSAVEAEISQWMTSASLSDFTRPRSLAGTGKTGTTSEQGPSPPSPASPDPFTSSSAPTSRVGSPVGSRSAGNRKTVTFSDPPSSHSSPTAGPTSLASPSALRSSAYLPAFAPSIQLPPALDDHYIEQRESTMEEESPTMPTYNTASSSSPSTKAPPSPPSPAPLVPILSNSSPRSAPVASGSSPPLLSPTQSPRQSHSRSRASSKLSQEIPRQELMGLKEDVERSSKRSSRGPGSISPVQSFADIRNAFRAIKPVSKRSKEKAAV